MKEKERLRLKLSRKIDQRADLQAHEYNRSGCARTRDWVHPTLRPGRVPIWEAPAVRAGRGKYKMWRGEAIAQTAYAPPQQPGRTASKAEGGSHGHARNCGMYTGDLIESRQDDRDKQLWCRSLDQPLRFLLRTTCSMKRNST